MLGQVAVQVSGKIAAPQTLCERVVAGQGEGIDKHRSLNLQLRESVLGYSLNLRVRRRGRKVPAEHTDTGASQSMRVEEGAVVQSRPMLAQCSDWIAGIVARDGGQHRGGISHAAGHGAAYIIVCE